MACVDSASGCQLYHPRGPHTAGVIVTAGTRVTVGTMDAIVIASTSVTDGHRLHIHLSLTSGRPTGQLWPPPRRLPTRPLGRPVDTPLAEE